MTYLYTDNGYRVQFATQEARDAFAHQVAFTKLRVARNKRLAASDVTSISDYPHADEATRQAWLDYRQALRDLPSNTTNPANPVWPSPPGNVINLANPKWLALPDEEGAGV